MEDKIAVAKQINTLLTKLIQLGGFKLKYRILVDPTFKDEASNIEKPELLVEFSGVDSGLLTERGCELLRSIETLAFEICRLERDDHEKISFDCNGFRRVRLKELQMAAKVSAEKVRETGEPYAFAPMSSRERRIVHMALRDVEGLSTQSEGEGPDRHLVIYPEGYKGKPPVAPPARRRR